MHKQLRFSDVVCSATGSGGINMKELGDTLVKAIVLGNLKANDAVRKKNEDASSMVCATNRYHAVIYVD